MSFPRGSRSVYSRCTHSPCGGHMRHIAFVSLFIAAAFALPAEAFAQPGSSHSLGRQVAIELCSSCHRVTGGPRLSGQNVASFFAIANLPSVSYTHLTLP